MEDIDNLQLDLSELSCKLLTNEEKEIELESKLEFKVTNLKSTINMLMICGIITDIIIYRVFDLFGL